MKLEDMLSQETALIVKEWFKLVIKTYPSDASRFLKQEENRFDNPIGYTISRELKNIFEELLNGVDSDSPSPFLDRILRIRAVQDFSPSQAVGFIFDLKKVIRTEMGSRIRNGGGYDELLKFESRIDRLAMLAFDVYTKCREEIFEIRVNEIKNRASRLLERAKLICDLSEEEPDRRDDMIDGKNMDLI